MYLSVLGGYRSFFLTTKDTKVHEGNRLVRSISDIIGLAAGAIALCSIGYYLLCLYNAARFLRERKAAGEGVRPAQSTQPVSILKPLRGTDPEMYESFRSHCLQNYPEYEIIFGVSDPADPAIELVERLKQEFPQRAIRLVICSRNLGTNTKVSNLAQMCLTRSTKTFWSMTVTYGLSPTTYNV